MNNTDYMAQYSECYPYSAQPSDAVVGRLKIYAALRAKELQQIEANTEPAFREPILRPVVIEA